MNLRCLRHTHCSKQLIEHISSVSLRCGLAIFQYVVVTTQLLTVDLLDT